MNKIEIHDLLNDLLVAKIKSDQISDILKAVIKKINNGEKK